MTTRLLTLGTVLLSALLVQTVVVPLVAPGLWRPDLVVLTVLGFALADGPGTGARYGFSAGLAVDLLSVGGPPVGVLALVLLLVGYGVGGLRPYLVGTGLPGELAVAFAASAGTVTAFGLLAMLLDAAPTSLGGTLRAALVTGVLNGLLAPFVLRPIAALSRHIRDLPSGGSSG